MEGAVASPAADKRYGGIRLETPMRRVGTSRQAAQKDNDASCSSLVEVIQCLIPCSSVCRSTTRKALRHRSSLTARAKGSSGGLRE